MKSTLSESHNSVSKPNARHRVGPRGFLSGAEQATRRFVGSSLNGLSAALIAIIVRPTGGLGTKYGVRFPRGERRDLVGTGARGTHGIWRNRQAISPEPVAFLVPNPHPLVQPAQSSGLQGHRRPISAGGGVIRPSE